MGQSDGNNTLLRLSSQLILGHAKAMRLSTTHLSSSVSQTTAMESCDESVTGNIKLSEVPHTGELYTDLQFIFYESSKGNQHIPSVLTVFSGFFL